MVSRLSLALVTLISSLFQMNAVAAVGHTAGQFAVSPTGSAQYSIPIWTPPGIRGIQPNLALTYDSHLSYGLMGPGWAINGLSVISRCNRTYAQDGTPAPIALTMADAFCLDGNRLRLTSSETLSTYGQPGTTYQTEIANFSNVTANGTAGNGPSYFTVKGKDGLTYEYGNTADSRIIPSGNTTPYVWALDKVTDRLGNEMTFTYYQSGGAYVPLSIQYTAPSGSTSFPYQVNFTYTTKSSNDTISKYVASSQIQQTQQLSTITATSAGTTVRTYKLLYTTSATTLRATLTSIQECGGSAGTDCLPAVSVGYQSGTAGVASPATPTGSGATNGTLITADIDGDGRQDLIFATTSGSNYQWWVQFATATGYGAPTSVPGAVTVGSANVLVDNFDAQGGNEILAPIGGTWHVFKWNGTSFTATDTLLGVSASSMYSSADVDGDGRPDLVYLTILSTGKTISIQLNTSTSTSIGFVTTPVTNSITAPGTVGVRLIGNNQMVNSSVKHMDFDGDGREDLVLMHDGPGGKGGSGPVAIVVGLLSRGTGPFVLGPEEQATQSAAGPPVEAVNWNDDSCTDLIVEQLLLIAACNGNYGSSIVLPAIPSLSLDWDGDGRTDLLANVGGTWQLIRSEGDTFAPAVSTSISVGSGAWAVTDKDGDGLHDLVFANSLASNAIYYGLHNGAAHPPDLMSSINDGYGNSITPSYTSIAESNYQRTLDASWPYEDYIGPLYVVYNARFSDPSNLPSGTYTKQYYYYGAWTNLQGRGFSGFNSYSVVDSRTTLFEHPYFQRAFPYTGMLYEDVWSNGAVYPRISQAAPAAKTLDGTANNQRYFPYFSSVRTNVVEVGGSENGVQVSTTLSTYAYDNYGNATTVATTVTDTDPGSPYLNDSWTTTTVNTISPNISTWCLNLPTETQVTNSSTAPGGAPITRTVSYTPDYTYCRENERVIEPNSATYKVTEDYTYDTAYGNFGNLHSVSVTGVAMTASPATRTTTITWTANGQFPLTITNPLTPSITLGFDPSNGMKISQTDPNSTTANPLKTTWSYDNFARELSELRPDGTSTTFTYNSCTANGCVNNNNKMTVTKTALNIGGSTQAIENIYLDSIDRTLVTSATMLSGAYDRNEIQYDNLGRVHQQGAPCTFVSCAAYWTSYNYDVLGRVTEIERPVNASSGQSYCDPTTVPPVSGCQGVAYNYQGRTTTVTDPQGKNTTTINLVTGSVARTQDHTGYYINYTYDAFGSVLSVIDSLSNTLNTMTYDYGVQAFQRTSNDADLGSRLSTYDALGELVAYSDAKHQNVSLLYDALSRPVTRTEPDLTTNWTWGSTATSFNIGKLQQVTAASPAGTYSEVYGYDSKTRLSSDTITIPGDTAYNYALAYNATTGLLDTLQYPVSTSGFQLKLQYAYQNGILQKVSDVTTGTPYWTANTINPRGQLTQETLGNNVVVKHTSDAVTGWVSSIQAGVGGGAALQNNSYLFDEVGNLTQRQDNNLPVVTENVYPDSLYRLGHTVGDTNTQMTYDGMGRIATWAAYGNSANVNDYTTAQSGCTYYANSQIHALRKSTQGSYPPESYCYDANGNLTTAKSSASVDLSVAWTSYDQPSYITGGTSSSQFFYNANHQRYKQIASYSGAPETTYYVGGLLEKMVNSSGTTYRHYIPAGNNTVVYTRLSTGANSTYYLTKDHLGTTAVITDSNGASLVKEKFAALGWNENTSAEQATMGSVTRHEFTGHEGLDNAGLWLVNMNGRIYLPSGSMFLSPDPYIPDPGNTQSFNRYSYVNYNPLSLIDPSGFDGSSPCDGCGTLVVNGYNYAIDALGSAGSALGDIFSSIWHSIFGGGGAKFNGPHGINRSIPLQGAAAFTPGSDGQFKITLDAASATQGPQVAAAAAAPPDSLQEITVTAERAPTLQEFAAQTAAEIQYDQTLLVQSRNLKLDTTTYWTVVGQSLARSGPKAATVALVAASLIPVIDIGADAALVARGAAQVTLNRAAGNAFRDELASQLSQAGRQVTTEAYKRTPFGKRFIDIEVSRDGTVLGGIETKVGASRYAPLQRLKDWWLTEMEGYPVNVARKP